MRVGDPSTFEAVAEVPPGAGTLIRAEWDFDGSGAWPIVDDDVDGSRRERVALRTSTRTTRPGTYFPPSA